MLLDSNVIIYSAQPDDFLGIAGLRVLNPFEELSSRP